jgi:hypothetical protein
MIKKLELLMSRLECAVVDYIDAECEGTEAEYEEAEMRLVEARKKLLQGFGEQQLVTSCLSKIDWTLFKAQKNALVLLTENHKTTTEEVLALNGIIHMMDAIQDEFMPVVENLL